MIIHKVNILFDGGALISVEMPGERSAKACYEMIASHSNSVQILHVSDFFVDMSKVIYASYEQVYEKRGWFS